MHMAGSDRSAANLWKRAMKSLDVLRGMYVRSPDGVKNALRPLISLVPTRFKFGRSYTDWRRRVEWAEKDPRYAADQHLAALRSLLGKAYQGSSFYRDIIGRSFSGHFDSSTFSPDDLQRLPVLNKEILKRAGDAVLAVPRQQVDVGETSGSNGEAGFAFYLDRDRSPREMAFIYDVWGRIGFSERDARASLRGFALKNPENTHDWDPALRELRLAVFPMTTADVHSYVDEIDRRQIRYIYGYPSAIELFCRRLTQIDRRPRLPIKGILPISEPLYEHQRELIDDTLGPVKFACFYGQSEKVAFAREVEGQRDLYEFNPLYGLTEVLDDDGQQVTEPGREGRIVATGFLSTGMPFIRYDTGDFGELEQRPCFGNGYRLRIRSLAPRRKPGFLVTFDGHRVVATDLAPENPEFFAGISEYQFFQDRPGVVTVRYILDGAGSLADAERLCRTFSAKTQGAVTFRPEEVTVIMTGRGGKRAYIDQRLKLELS